MPSDKPNPALLDAVKAQALKIKETKNILDARQKEVDALRVELESRSAELEKREARVEAERAEFEGERNGGPGPQAREPRRGAHPAPERAARRLGSPRARDPEDQRGNVCPPEGVRGAARVRRRIAEHLERRAQPSRRRAGEARGEREEPP